MSSPTLAQRIKQVQEPVIPIVGSLIAAHPGTISLGQGVVHYAPPSEILECLGEVDTSVHNYGGVFGQPDLIECIRDKLLSENGFSTLEKCMVAVTAGSNMGFLHALLAICDVGDEVILFSPYYFNHHMAIELCGCRAICVPTAEDYQIDFERLESSITDRTRAIVTVSPNNPTGVVYPQAALARVNEMCVQRNIFHISDEAYEYFIYDNVEHYSPASASGSSDHTISLFTLSKAYGMAGWRVGYMVAPKHLATSIKKVQDTNLVCAPIICQQAALAALQAGRSWCQPKINDLQVVRDQLLEHLSEFREQCKIPVPQGAFYLMLQLPTELSDMQVVETMIRDFGVAALPGSTFGDQSGCSIRISFGALDADSIVDGVGRLRTALKSLL